MLYIILLAIHVGEDVVEHNVEQINTINAVIHNKETYVHVFVAQMHVGSPCTPACYTAQPGQPLWTRL